MSGFSLRNLRFARGSAMDLPEIKLEAVALQPAALDPNDFVAVLAETSDGELDDEFIECEVSDAHTAPLRGPLVDEVPLLTLGGLVLASGQIAVLHAEASAATSHLIAQVLGLTATAMEGVALWGHPVQRLRPAAIRAMRQRIGVVPQRLQLLDRRSVFDNVALPLEIDGIPSGQLIERTEALLVDFDLAKVAGRAVGTLSLAMQQRVAFARACVRHPELVLADQPTLHQDDAGATFVADQLELMRVHGATALIVTCDDRMLARARREGWRVYDLQDGLPVLASDVDRAFDIVFGDANGADDGSPTGGISATMTLATLANYAD